MIEPWFSKETGIYAAVLITVPAGMILGVMPGLFGLDFSDRYSPIVAVIGLSLCAVSFVFGIIAWLYSQPSFLYSSFLLAGAIGGIVIAGGHFLHK